jgi:hypothetical protein
MMIEDTKICFCVRNSECQMLCVVGGGKNNMGDYVSGVLHFQIRFGDIFQMGIYLVLKEMEGVWKCQCAC